MKQSYRYRVVIEWSEADEAFIALVPAISGCITHGDTRQEAAANIEEALEGVLEAMRANGIPIPSPN